MIACLLAFLAFTAIDSVRNGLYDGVTSAMVFAGIAALGLILAYFGVRRTYRDPREIATKIEATFPDLDQRLLTALSQSESDSGKPLGYLQTRVIREARDHSRENTWTDTLPAGELLLSRFCGFLSLGALVAVLGVLATAGTDSDQQGIASLTLDEVKFEVEVVPGNTEVERGNSLAITALSLIHI